MKHVVILGAGGQGREVAEILHHQVQIMGGTKVLGFVDERCDLHGQTIEELPVLGDWSWFEDPDRAEVAVICAVGQPQVCRQLVRRAERLGLSFAQAISPLAHISPSAHIGQGAAIFPNVVVNTHAFVADHSILNVAVTVSHDTVVGPYCNVNPGTHLAGGVTIGEGCYIGMGTNVIQGVSIGDWTVVGAGAVVTQDLPSNVTAVGVPARVVKTREEGWQERQALLSAYSGGIE